MGANGSGEGWGGSCVKGGGRKVINGEIRDKNGNKSR